MKGWAEIWSSFPAAHKQRCYQGVAGYGLLVLATAAWVSVRAHDTVKDWQGRIPFASAPIKSMYLTPQITDVTKGDTQQAAVVAPQSQQPVVDDGKTYITIIVSGLGMSSLATERAVNDLPPQMTLAFSPYAANVHAWISKALSAHHETLMLLPMETASYPQDDPGPRALSSRFSNQDNDDNLNWLLSQGSGSVGVLNLMGTRFLNDEKRLSSAFATLRKNDAMFIESPEITKSAAPGIAAETGLPFMEANLQIDASATDRSIRAQLDSLEKIAHKRGYAIGVAQPYPLTLNILKSWASELEARGIILAPLRTVWKNKPHYEENTAQSAAGRRLPNQNSASPDPEKYRPGVGIVLFNKDGHVLIAERLDNPGGWQMPQGGIDAGEAPEVAVFREMEEEIGTRNAKIIGMVDDWIYYDFPSALGKKLWSGRYIGQRQKWIALKFLGQDSDIILDTHHDPEFSRWKWVPLHDLMQYVVPFKRAVYERVIKEFSKYAQEP